MRCDKVGDEEKLIAAFETTFSKLPEFHVNKGPSTRLPENTDTAEGQLHMIFQLVCVELKTRGYGIHCDDQIT